MPERSPGEPRPPASKRRKTAHRGRQEPRSVGGGRDQHGPITIGGIAVGPGERRHIDLEVARLPTHTELSIPIVVVRGRRPGPCLWISAAIHGDELNGVEVIRRVLDQVPVRKLRGTLLACPIVNVFGFLQQSRYLPDGRDLNRSFPGSKRGSLASRLAHLFMTEVVSHCTHGVDLHTGTRNRTNLPQIRADLDDEETLRCAVAFGAPAMLHSRTRDSSLREAATKRGIAVLLYEAGEALRFGERSIIIGTRGVLGVMRCLGMIEGGTKRRAREPVLLRSSRWIRAPRSGILRLDIRPGDRVTAGQALGTVANAFGEDAVAIRAPAPGLVVGKSRIPVVNQGDGIVNLGFETGAGDDT